jgi:hypothetical protein
MSTPAQAPAEIQPLRCASVNQTLILFGRGLEPMSYISDRALIPNEILGPSVG